MRLWYTLYALNGQHDTVSCQVLTVYLAAVLNLGESTVSEAISHSDFALLEFRFVVESLYRRW